LAAGATARLFISLAPPRQLREELAAWGRAAVSACEAGSDARPLDADLLHLTLCFLGERPLDEIDAIAEALYATDGAAPALEFGAPVLLPPRSPRALAVMVTDDDGALAAMHADLARAVSAATAWRADRRRFRPHITVVRTRAGTRLGGKMPPTPSVGFIPQSIDLQRSYLGPAGARYETIAAAPLGGR